jgi:hypothetical protein
MEWSCIERLVWVNSKKSMNYQSSNQTISRHQRWLDLQRPELARVLVGSLSGGVSGKVLGDFMEGKDCMEDSEPLTQAQQARDGLRFVSARSAA